jgi:hypothetical protein
LYNSKILSIIILIIMIITFLYIKLHTYDILNRIIGIKCGVSSKNDTDQEDFVCKLRFGV